MSLRLLKAFLVFVFGSLAIPPSGLWLGLSLVEWSHLTLEVPSGIVRVGSYKLLSWVFIQLGGITESYPSQFKEVSDCYSVPSGL